jgi:hypothetical protein
MTEQKMAVPVLARFPDVNDGLSDGPGHETKGFGLLASSGRLIGQAVSIKLLAGTTLFLIVGAILPFCMSGKTPATDPATGHDSLVATTPKSAKTAPASDEAVALVASRPAVLVVPSKDPSPAPAMLPPTIAIKTPSNPATEPLQTSSQWQPPKGPGTNPLPNVDQPPVRQAEYEADTNATPGNNRDNRR